MALNIPDMFLFDVPLAEIFIRGTAMYLGVLVILRTILQREVGSVGIPDLLMITLIADATQNGMAGEYHSIPSGLFLVVVLVFWNFLLDWASSRFPWFEILVRPRPVRLVRNGNIQTRNLRLVSMSRSELASLLRQKGFETATSLKAVYLEGNGEISVIE